MINRFALIVSANILFLSCIDTSKKINTIEGNIKYNSVTFIAKEKLSDYNKFEFPLNQMKPKSGTFPYDLNSELFSDYASKKRFIYIPEQSAMKYDSLNVFSFPHESLIFKFFYYPKSKTENEIIETRVLYNNNGTWEAFTYLWDSLQNDAFLLVAGTNRSIVRTEQDGKIQRINYSVPNIVQCKSCHEFNGKIMPIGPAARHLNKQSSFASGNANQLQIWSEQKKLKFIPNQENLIPKNVDYLDNSKSLDERARSYLDINCSHCHNSDGPARNSALNLRFDENDKHKLGVYKKPIAAGNGSGGLFYDIVPGKADQSILLYRMNSNKPGVAMPELSRTLIHNEGVALIKEWINNMAK